MIRQKDFMVFDIRFSSTVMMYIFPSESKDVTPS